MRVLFAWSCLLHASLLAARPADAQDLVAKTEARTPAERAQELQAAARLRDPARRGRAGHQQADEPRVRRARPAVGHRAPSSTRTPRRPGTTPRDKVIVLSDFGDDGRARKVETFAEGLNIPLGVLPLENGALVFAIDHIRKFTDTDGDGKADKDEKFLGTYGSRDTHGMTNHFTVGFDGWVYANHGFNNDSDGDGEGRLVDQDELRQRLPLQARRLARRVLRARAGQPVRPGVRPARQPLLRRLPHPAAVPAAARRVLPELRQAATTAWASARR